MEYANLDDIKKKFNVDGDNLDDIRKQLVKALVKYHPDKTGGKFESEDSEKKYLEVEKAIKYIDNEKKSGHLIKENEIKESEIKELVKIIKDIVPEKQRENYHDVINKKIDANVLKLKSANRVPRITSASITGILTAIMAFPSTITKNPILKKLINLNDKIFIILWLCSLYITAILWITTKLNESRYEEQLKKLSDIYEQDKLFEEYISSHREDKIDKLGFIGFIGGEHEDRHFSMTSKILFQNNYLPREVLQVIADNTFSKAEKKGIIEIINNKSMIDEYRIIKES